MAFAACRDRRAAAVTADRRVAEDRALSALAKESAATAVAGAADSTDRGASAERAEPDWDRVREWVAEQVAGWSSASAQVPAKARTDWSPAAYVEWMPAARTASVQASEERMKPEPAAAEPSLELPARELLAPMADGFERQPESGAHFVQPLASACRIPVGRFLYSWESWFPAT